MILIGADRESSDDLANGGFRFRRDLLRRLVLNRMLDVYSVEIDSFQRSDFKAFTLFFTPKLNQPRNPFKAGMKAGMGKERKGSIVERDGKFYFRISYTDSLGKKRGASVLTDTRLCGDVGCETPHSQAEPMTLFLRRFRYGFPCVERVLNKVNAGIRFNLRSPLFCVHYPFVFLRRWRCL